MVPLRLPRPVADELVATVAHCGEGRRECVVYVVAPISDRFRASGVLHPGHTTTAISTEVGPNDLDRIWDKLIRTQQTLILQVHSHPEGAHHSGIDDQWPVVHRVGFPSLVLAQFGTVGLRDSHLAIYLGEGRWEEPRSGRWSDYLVFESGA